MPVIEVSNLSKVFGNKRAIDNLSFSVDEGEILVIVGSSGCGKTTTLRCIAGLDTPTTGTIKVEGRTVVSDSVFVPPEKRGIGMVFQSYALWPHKTVFDNIAYSLVIKGSPREEIRRAVADAVALVGLSGMEDRFPSTLSGGQQQRVALARCAVAEPRVLLLDEPLSNLDAKLREQMRDELKLLIKKLKSTAVHITHDQSEAMAIADRIICMRDGRVEQMGSARDLYRRPANRFVADFIGIASFVDGTVSAAGDGSQRVKVRIASGDELWAEPTADGGDAGEVTLCIRPETVELTVERPQGANVLSGTVTDSTFLGDHTEYRVDIGGGTIIKSRSQADFSTGSTVYAAIDPEKLISLPRGAVEAARRVA